MDMRGQSSENGAVLFAAHADTPGAVIAEIKGNGRLWNTSFVKKTSILLLNCIKLSNNVGVF